MTKPKDPVAMAKDLSKATGIPLPYVSQVMQKYPINTSRKALEAALDKEATRLIEVAAAVEVKKKADLMRKNLSTCFLH